MGNTAGPLGRLFGTPPSVPTSVYTSPTWAPGIAQAQATPYSRLGRIAGQIRNIAVDVGGTAIAMANAISGSRGPVLTVAPAASTGTPYGATPQQSQPATGGIPPAGTFLGIGLGTLAIVVLVIAVVLMGRKR
jgi:hypothetical protein